MKFIIFFWKDQSPDSKILGSDLNPRKADKIAKLLPFCDPDSDCGDLWERHRPFWAHYRSPTHLQGQNGRQVLKEMRTFYDPC